ncbi:MAG: hypothetical protein GY769_01795 [bacterium]|nr:hypothetical protein [bacterium]
MGLEFGVEKDQVDQFLTLAPKKTSLAVLRSVKRGTMAARTVAARTVSKDMGIAVSVVRKSIVMTTPSGKTGAVGILRASLKRIPLYLFKARGPFPSRGKGRGVTYRKGGGRANIRDAFIAKMPSGHMGVFKRSGRARLPVKQLFGPSIGRVFDLKRKAIMEAGAEAGEKELDRLLDRIFGTGSKR